MSMSSIFMDPKHTSLVADIETRANPIGKSMSKPLALIVVGGAGGMMLGGPVVAGAMAALPLWFLLKSLKGDVDKNQFTRRNPGAIAHLISSEQDMVAWVEAHGAPEVKRQLLLAMQSGQPMTATAKRVASAIIPENELPAANLAAYLPKLTEATGANLPTVSALLGAETFAGVPAAGAGAGTMAIGGTSRSDLSTPPSTRDELIARLKQDCPVMLNLVKSHPIRAVGVQRSGKTTLVKLVALLRVILMENHEVIASTPHYEPENPYPNVFRVVGWDEKTQSRDYNGIRKAWQQMQDDVAKGGDANITYIWDEFGLQDQAIPTTPDDDPIKDAVKSCLRETMKFGIYPIFIIHGETAEFLPGSKGLVTVFKGSTARLEAIGEPITGTDGLPTIKPTGRFKFTGLDGLESSGEIPAWLNEKYLLEMIASKGGAKLPPEMEVIANMTLAQSGMKSAAPAPTIEDLKVVGRGLSKALREKVSRQTGDSELKEVIKTQNDLVGNGQYMEAIQTMIPHVCPTPESFSVMFPESGNVLRVLQGGL
jgi:hypothetical protein